MSKAAFMMLHYGKPYLAQAIEAIYPQVDVIAIAYTDSPSQSWPTDKTCPDTEKELKALAEPWMDKIIWKSGRWDHEHEHCDAARAIVKDYDWKMRLDADEIFPPGSVDFYINQAKNMRHQAWRIPFMHFWRCFDKVCRDTSHPIRLERNEGTDSGWLDDPDGTHTVYHMGYAMPDEYIRYKMDVQGHHSEWRQDWYEKRWLPNAQDDVHPVMFRPPFWDTQDYDKTKMPEVLKKHHYYNVEIIK